MAGSCLLAAVQVGAACLTYESTLTGARLDCKSRNRETAPNSERRQSQTAPIPDGANPGRRQSRTAPIPKSATAKGERARAVFVVWDFAPVGIGALRDWRSSGLALFGILRRSAVRRLNRSSGA